MKKLLVVMLILFTLASSGQSSSVADRTTQPGVSNDATIPAGRILQWGVYTLMRGGKVIDDPRTSTGKGVARPVITRDRETDRIPLIRDKYMAYQYRLSNLPGKRSVKLRRVLKHPPMQLPDGTVSTGSDFFINRKLERGEVFAYDAYALNEDYEMVEGDWTFQIWFREALLVEQKFRTYWPENNEFAN